MTPRKKGNLIALGIVASVVVLTAGSCDRGARKDLPNENQVLDQSDATIIVNPDRFPNVAHKCSDTTGVWTTTGGAVWIVYNDPECGGNYPEGAGPQVLDNIPGSSSTS